MAAKQNLIGRRFFKLIVIEQSTKKTKRVHWVCKCDCGNIIHVTTSDLNSGNAKSCGSHREKEKENLIGKKFGRLTVISESFRGFAKKTSRQSRTYANVKCECGKTKRVQIYYLKNKHTTSCGCVQVEITQARSITHGSSNTPEYRAWAALKRRCLNKNRKEYLNYGGRGIIVCKRWINSFEKFYKDMGKRPSPKLTVERVNNNGNYEPSNCVWDTKTAQARNRRTTKWLKCNGERGLLSDWAKKLNISPSTLHNRLRKNTLESIVEKTSNI